MTPRSSGPGGEYPPLRGTTNLRLTANQHCNVTENCAGVLAAATSPANRVAAQLQTAWVTFGKQTLSTSRKRQSLDLELNSRGRLVAGNTFFGTAQPGELGIEDSNSLGGGFPGNWPGRGGKRCQHQSAAGSLVTSVGLAAAGSQAAELLRGLIKKDIGVGGHPALFNGL